jgi:hypothetical protein
VLVYLQYIGAGVCMITVYRDGVVVLLQCIGTDVGMIIVYRAG